MMTSSQAKVTNEEVERPAVGGVRTSSLVFIPQTELPSLLQIQPPYLLHQTPRTLRHQTHTGPAHKLQPTELLPGYATLAEVEQETSELDLGGDVVCAVVIETGRREKECVCVWSEVDVVVYHEDWVYGGMGARE